MATSPRHPRVIAVEAGIQLDLTDAAADADVEVVKSVVEFLDGPDETMRVPEREKVVVAAVAGDAGVANAALSENMGDAPACSNCGHMTIRNGSCYVCLTCGDTTGCS